MHPVGKKLCVGSKNESSFLMGTTSSTPCKIALRAPAVGVKTWCLYVFFCHAPEAGALFTAHRPKIRFFAPQGRLVAPIHVKLGRADGHVGPLGCAKFHLNRRRRWECGTKISKCPLFGKEKPRRGDSLDRFLKFLRVFMRLTIIY